MTEHFVSQTWGKLSTYLRWHLDSARIHANIGTAMCDVTPGIKLTTKITIVFGQPQKQRIAFMRKIWKNINKLNWTLSSSWLKPGGVLIKELPPLVIVSLLNLKKQFHFWTWQFIRGFQDDYVADGNFAGVINNLDSSRGVPDTFPCREVGEHVLLKKHCSGIMMMRVTMKMTVTMMMRRRAVLICV